MPIVLFVDVVNSTAYREERGIDAARLDIDARLASIEDVLQGADLTYERMGPYQGDGFLAIGQDAQALLSAAITEQALYQGLPVRIAFGSGEIRWSGEPHSPGTSVSGPVVDFVHRLLAFCPPGGVILEEGMHSQVRGYPRFHRHLIAQEGVIRGLAGTQRYWIVRGAGEGPAPGSVPSIAEERDDPVENRRTYDSQIAVLQTEMLHTRQAISEFRESFMTQEREWRNDLKGLGARIEAAMEQHAVHDQEIERSMMALLAAQDKRLRVLELWRSALILAWALFATVGASLWVFVRGKP